MSLRSVLLFAAVVLPGCGGGSSAPESAAAPPGGSVTLWTDSTELFMDIPG